MKRVGGEFQKVMQVVGALIQPPMPRESGNNQQKSPKKDRSSQEMETTTLSRIPQSR